MRNLPAGGALILLFLPACIKHRQPPLTPEETVLRWQSCVDKNQFAAARQLSTPQATAYLDYLDAITEDTTGSDQTQLLELRCALSGDSATCSFFTEDEVGEKIPDTLTLRRIKGQWRIDRVEGFLETPLDTLRPGDENLVFPPSDTSGDQEME